MMLALKHGMYRDIPAADYHVRELGIASKSALDFVARSPMHYKAWVDGAEEASTHTLAFGSAFHCALLEPQRYKAEYASEPEWGDCRYKAAKDARDQWRAEHQHVRADHRLSHADAEAISAMVVAVERHPLAGRMIRDGSAELTARWKDVDTGLECKARTDYYVEQHAMIVDVKSTADASYPEFRRSVSNYGYHRQAALYAQGFASLGAPAKYFVFVAVERMPPHGVAIYTLDDEALARGQTSIRKDLHTLAGCIRTGRYEGYPNSIQTLSLPPWAA